MARAKGKEFTRLANQLIENIFACKLQVYELKMLLKVARLTYGWGTNWMRWDRGPFLDGIPSNKIYFIRDQLLDKGILKKRHGGIGIERRGEKWKVEWLAEGYPKQVPPWSKQNRTPQSYEEGEVGLTSPINRTHQSYKEDSTVLSTGGKPGADAKVQTPKERKEKKDKYSEEFLEWYTLYPRKIGVANAYKAWVKYFEKQHCFSLEEVKQLLQNYVRGEWKDRPKDKIPHPATWLNSEPWEDAKLSGSANLYEKEVKDAYKSLERVKHQRGYYQMEEGPDKDQLEDELTFSLNRTLDGIRRKYGKAKTE